MDPITIAMGLATLAPNIIKLLTGSDKAADVADKVVDVAKAITGTDSEESALHAMNTASPEQVLAFRQRIAELDAEAEKARLADMASARAMQVAALGQEDLFSKRFVYYFAGAWSAFAMCYFVAVTFCEIPVRGQRIADTILGVLIGTVLVGIFHYFFGSTNGSRHKSDLLASKGAA